MSRKSLCLNNDTKTLCVRWKQMINQFVVNSRAKQMLSFIVPSPAKSSISTNDLNFGNRFFAKQIYKQNYFMWTWKFNKTFHSFLSNNTIVKWKKKYRSKNLIVNLFYQMKSFYGEFSFMSFFSSFSMN